MAVQPSPLESGEPFRNRPFRNRPALRPLPSRPQRLPPWAPLTRAVPAALGAVIVVLTIAAVAVARSLTAIAATSPASASEERGVLDIASHLPGPGIEVMGTGIALGAGGEVVTNDHVVEGASTIVATDVVTGRSYGATVVGSDAADDVAVLQLAGDPAVTLARTGDSSAVAVGDTVVAVGNTAGRGGTPTAAAGKVTGLDQGVTVADGISGTFERLQGLIGTDAAVQAGDSGGPLLDTAGRVIGMDTAASGGFVFRSDSVGGFAIPIGVVLRLAGHMSDTIPPTVPLQRRDRRVSG